MSPLSALAPDQRAVLELLLRQGRDYGELAELLGLPEDGVRSRAHTALAALAPERVAPVGEDGAVADWILGQQDGAEAERTRGAIARMPAWHAWASEVTDRLSEVDGAELPELPKPEAGPQAQPRRPAAARRPRPVRDATTGAGAQHARRRAGAGAAAAAPGRPQRSSRLGGLVLLAGAALAVAVVLFFVFRGGDDDPAPASSSASATPTAAGSAEPQVVAEIPLKGNGNRAQGLMRVFSREQGGLVFALAAEKIPANRPREVYSVWFTKQGSAPKSIGFSQTQVGKQRVFTTGGPLQGQETKLAKLLADYEKVVVARGPVTGPKAGRLGPIVLTGTLPGGQG